MGNSEKKTSLEKYRETNIERWEWKMEGNFIHLKKELQTIYKEGNDSTTGMSNSKSSQNHINFCPNRIFFFL